MSKDKTEPFQNFSQALLVFVLKGFCFILPHFAPFYLFTLDSLPCKTSSAN